MCRVQFHQAPGSCQVSFTLLVVAAGLWDDMSFQASGNLFWPDFWSTPASSQQQALAYDMVGLEHKQAQVRACYVSYCSVDSSYSMLVNFWQQQKQLWKKRPCTSGSCK
jgi:hypothetical protein